MSLNNRYDFVLVFDVRWTATSMATRMPATCRVSMPNPAMGW